MVDANRVKCPVCIWFHHQRVIRGCGKPDIAVVGATHQQKQGYWREEFIWHSGLEWQRNVLRLCVVADFGALHCQPTTNVDLKNSTSIYHWTRHYAKPLLPAGVLSTVSVNHWHYWVSLSFCVGCVSGVLFFFWSVGKNILKFFLGAERWKLFCNFWSVRWLVRIANVLTPVRWLFMSLFRLLSFLLVLKRSLSPTFACQADNRTFLKFFLLQLSIWLLHFL